MFRNTVVFAAASFGSLLASFALAPIMLTRLGLEQYGVWAVTGVFTAYAALIDLGITRSIGRFVAVYHAKQDRRAVEQCLGLGLIAITVVGLFAFPAALLLAPVVTHALDDVLTVGEMRIVLVAACAILVLNLYRGAFDAVPYGVAQYTPPAVSDTANTVLNFALSVGALLISRELTVYAVANAVAMVFGLVFSALSMRHVWGRLAFRRPTRAITNEILGFSLKGQVATVMDIVSGQAGKLILALFVDVRAAAAYDIGARVAGTAKALGILSMSAVTPTATAEITREGAGVVPELYRRFTVRAMSVSMPFIALLCAAGPALLVAWLDEVPANTLAVFLAFALANGLSLTVGVAHQLALSEGRAGFVAVTSLIASGLTIVAMLALAPPFGLTGIIVAVVVGIAGSVLAFLVYWHRLHHIPAGVYLRSVGPPVALAILAAAPACVWWLLPGSAVDDRLSAVVTSVLVGAVFAAIYWPLATRLDLLPQQLRLDRVGRAIIALMRRRPAAVG